MLYHLNDFLEKNMFLTKINVERVTPEKSNIDTKDGHILKESPFPRPIILGPSMVVFGDV